MKIQLLLIITFYLISGPVYCLDVTGFPGGHVIIDFKHKINLRSAVFFCKLTPDSQCERIIIAQGTELIRDVNKGRFTLISSDRSLTLIIRTLRVQDTGLYQVGEQSVWNEDINLKLNRDPCCSEMKSVPGYLGQNVTISCSYPEEFERNTKSFYKQNNRSLTEIIRTSGTEPHQDGRFSISDDVRNKVFSVNINDVIEDDGGVYFCAVVKHENEIISHSLFTKIHLQTTEAAQFTTKNPDVPSDTPEPDSPSPSRKYSITISVVVFVILLLGVGLALTFYQQKWKKSQAKDFPECAPGSLHKLVMEKPSEIPYYEEITDYRHHPDPEATAYYSAIPLSTTPSDPLISVYATAQLPTTPSDLPNTVYPSAQLPTTPTDLPNTLYATAQLPTAPSDLPNTVYSTAQLPATPSDLPNTMYPTAQLPTTPSDLPNTVYPSAQLPTTPTDLPNTVYPIAKSYTTPSDLLKTMDTTAQLPTTPSDLPNTVYPTAQLPTTPSDLLKTMDTTAQLPTTPSDLPNTVYQTAQLPTTPSDLPKNMTTIAELPTILSDPPVTM